MKNFFRNMTKPLDQMASSLSEAVSAGMVVSFTGACCLIGLILVFV